MALKLSPRFYFQGQFAFWGPIGGSPDFQGPVIHYHTSLNYLLWNCGCDLQLVGTLEAAARLPQRPVHVPEHDELRPGPGRGQCVQRGAGPAVEHLRQDRLRRGQPVRDHRRQRGRLHHPARVPGGGSETTVRVSSSRGPRREPRPVLFLGARYRIQGTHGTHRTWSGAGLVFEWFELGSAIADVEQEAQQCLVLAVFGDDHVAPGLHQAVALPGVDAARGAPRRWPPPPPRRRPA